MSKMYRHGDVLLIKIDKLPDNAKFKVKKGNIILEGEVTGHAHRLKGEAKILEVAEKIVNNAQNSPYKGWKAFEDRKNRYWLVENILNDTYTPIRECIYNYHLLGLDVMSDKVNDGRAVIAESLESFRKVHQKKPSSFLMQLFFDAKRDEIVNIFSESFPDEKRRVYNILKEINPANSSKYEQIIK